jgi:hypothetical protein
LKALIETTRGWFIVSEPVLRVLIYAVSSSWENRGGEQMMTSAIQRIGQAKFREVIRNSRLI